MPLKASLIVRVPLRLLQCRVLFKSVSEKGSQAVSLSRHSSVSSTVRDGTANMAPSTKALCIAVQGGILRVALPYVRLY